MSQIDYVTLGKKVRKDIITMLVKAGRGHIASSLSVVEMLLVLYEKIMKYDPKNPDWDDRDRFILSKGHGCMGLYAILVDKGFFPKEELDKFCKIDGILGGHPEHEKIPGVEASTGALGHGPSVGVGMALRAKLDKKDYRVFVTVGDGECNEGSVWEAALSAAKHKLDNFTILMDYNKLQSYGPVSDVLPLEPVTDKWKAFGFNVFEANLDRPEELEKILSNKEIYKSGKPNVVVCHTIKGKGIPMTENNLKWHHKTKLTDKEIEELYKSVE